LCKAFNLKRNEHILKEQVWRPAAVQPTFPQKKNRHKDPLFSLHEMRGGPGLNTASHHDATGKNVASLSNAPHLENVTDQNAKDVTSPSSTDAGPMREASLLTRSSSFQVRETKSEYFMGQRKENATCLDRRREISHNDIFASNGSTVLAVQNAKKKHLIHKCGNCGNILECLFHHGVAQGM
jgi:hypothetical protein